MRKTSLGFNLVKHRPEDGPRDPGSACQMCIVYHMLHVMSRALNASCIPDMYTPFMAILCLTVKSTVVFEGLYFTDGAIKTYATIENNGNLIIKNCSFDSFETGAIIYNSGLLNILNSTFSLNFVNNAVVWNDADLVIDTVEFSYNIVNTSSVVYNNGAAEIISANVTGNYNFGNGGAIYNAKSLSVKDTV